jgi:hypothetical protein
LDLILIHFNRNLTKFDDEFSRGKVATKTVEFCRKKHKNREIFMIFSAFLGFSEIYRGSDGEVVRASDFHFNVPWFESRFGHGNFSSTFHHFSNFGIIRTLDR